MIANSQDKYRSVLATPMGDEMARFCNSNEGMEVFTVNMAYEMCLSACYKVRYSDLLFKNILFDLTSISFVMIG